MASEYHLTYTAAEIDERLGKAGNAVLYTKQSLGEEQKSQARANIGAAAIGEYSSAIVCEASGEVIAVADAADRPLKGLSICGKTIQNGTPTPSAPVALESVGESIGVKVCGKNLLPFPYADGTKTHNGITYTVNADGSITANGTATATSDFNLCLSKSPFQLKEGEQYIYSGCPKGGSNTTYRIRLQDNTYYQSENDTGDGIAFTARYENFYAWIDIKAGTTLNNLTFYPMIRLASTGAEFEPYKGQTLTATAEGGLCGIGEVKDEIDFARGVRVQRLYKHIVSEADTIYDHNNGYIYLSLGKAIKNGYTYHMCSVPARYTGSEGLYIEPQIGYYSNASELKAYAQSNCVEVIVVLAEPIETPLTAEELAQFAALHSNKPNTTAFNDAGADMKLNYVADTKLYIDQKIAAISAALLNT